jgi:ribosomal protein L40E
MGIFEDVVSKAKSAADFAGKKTGEIVEISKLRFLAADLQSKINKEYLDLGIIVFNAEKSGEDFKEEITNKSTVIEDLYHQLSKTNEKIAELRRMKKCLVCNYANPEDANYCLKCGAKL